MNIALRPDLAKFVAEEIQAGRYESPEQVVEAALARLMLEPADDFGPGEFDELIAEGEADIERGDVSDADEVFERLRQYSAEYRKSAAECEEARTKAMSLRILITRSAEKDLRGIWSYTMSRSDPDIADRVVEEIRAELKKLADMPRMGHQRPDIKNPQYRVWSVYSYLIVYRITGKSVTVSRIVSGHRNIGRLFRRKKG